MSIVSKGSLRGPNGRAFVGPPVLGRKYCRDCWKWRYLIDFPVAKKTRKGIPYYWEPTCYYCLKPRRQAYLARSPKVIARRRETDRLRKAERRRMEGIQPRAWVNPPKSTPAPTRADFVDNTALRERYLLMVRDPSEPEDDRWNAEEIASRCGWFWNGDPDTLRVQRLLGIVKGNDGFQKRMSYENAVTIARALEMAPVEAGV